MLGKNTFIAFVVFSLCIISSAHAVTPPPGWQNFPADNTKVRPNLPSTDFFYPTSSDPTWQRPVCGVDGFGNGRIPVLPSFEPRPISTSYYPNSSMEFDGTATSTATVPTARSSSDSTYLYDSLTRCVCMSAPVNVSPSPAPISDSTPFPGGNYPSGYTRIYPDTYDVISTQNQSASVKYNMVAYTADPAIDGRQGVNFSDTSVARCGCPNINEVPVTNSVSGSGIVGSHCEPLLNNSSTYPGRVLTTYNPSYHGASVSPALLAVLGPQIADVNNEGLDGTIAIPQILLPTNSGGSQRYDRKIYTCAPPYKTNFANQRCEPPVLNEHACAATSNKETASPVSRDVTPTNDPIAQFNNTINKKLACCTNDMGKVSDTGAFVKFDCVDNSTLVNAAGVKTPINYNTFDALWTSSDNANDGGWSNAMVLSGPLGQYLTGFYTVDGVRCNEYSEVAGSYGPTKVFKNSSGVWDKLAQGPVLNPPGSTGGGLQNIFSSKGKTVPTTALEMKRCPIVARAAFIATCPEDTELPVVKRTYLDTTTGVRHCSAASIIQVHVNIQQIFEIEGQAKMPTVDTIMERRLASSISVEKMIANKDGDYCPGGAIKRGDVCVYE